MSETESSADDEPGHDGFRGFIEWLDEKLYPALGPPPLGPYGPVVERVAVAVCPVCSRPMSEHMIQRSGGNAVLNCPVAHERREPDVRPLDELGMPRRGD